MSTRLGSRLTDEMIDALRQRIGVERPIPYPYNTEATWDAIRHFAHGIGDLNPLWQDAGYAAQTRWGGVIAPPCFLFSCGFGRTGGLPGVHGMFAGSEWTFYRPIRVGTPIQATMQLAEVIEKTGQFAGRQILQIDESIYRDGEGHLLATARNPVMRTERQTAQDKGKYARIEQKIWTPDELRAIDDELAQRATRRHASLLARCECRRRPDAAAEGATYHHRLHWLADGLGLAVCTAAPGGF